MDVVKMVLSKQELSNGNVFIWLGKGGIWGKGEESDDIDNVLILSGGEVLFLKAIKVMPLYEEKVRQDIRTLKYEEFTAKYNLPANIDLWKDLKEGAESGEYPPFLKAAQKEQHR